MHNYLNNIIIDLSFYFPKACTAGKTTDVAGEDAIDDCGTS